MDCNAQAGTARGLCKSHYMMWWRYGDPLHPRKQALHSDGAIGKFNFWVKKTDSCWLWKGNLDKRGYGRIIDDTGWLDMAHRWSYKNFIGDIPEGLVLDHLCHTPACVNPKHLEPVTHRQNIIERGRSNAAYINSQKTHCIHGHSLADAYIAKSKYGLMRNCRVCQGVRSKKWWSRRAIK